MTKENRTIERMKKLWYEREMLANASIQNWQPTEEKKRLHNEILEIEKELFTLEMITGITIKELL